MKITITIPIETDGPLTASEQKKLVKHIRKGLPSKMAVVKDHFDTEPRMLGTVCRFRFKTATARVED